jgi:uncharacterized membrane protein
MTGMTAYYVSRTLISAGFGVLLAATGTTWWVAALMAGIVFLLFLWAPQSGRYAVHPELGVTALRRDERTQGINDKAAKNAFVVVMLAVLGLVLYYGRLAPAEVPVSALDLLLALGALTYFGTDLWLRRTSGAKD